jgi:hypothetical protein
MANARCVRRGEGCGRWGGGMGSGGGGIAQQLAGRNLGKIWHNSQESLVVGGGGGGVPHIPQGRRGRGVGQIPDKTKN